MSNDFKYSTCWEAAGQGDFEELKRMHEYGMPLYHVNEGFYEELDNNSASNAAENGHFDCLRYAHENGCELHFSLLINLAVNGYLDCLRYAIENGCNVLTEIAALNSK